MPALTPQLASSYQQLFDSCVIKPDKYPAVDKVIQIILSGRSSYEAVTTSTQVPWHFIGIVHSLECSSKFNTHLHNGDPLTARTTHVPRGRPKSGTAPFTWESSAEDSLQFQELDQWKDWSIAGTLYQFEKYNGFGYRRQGIASPYLWSFSIHYTKGKYAADGEYDPSLISKQCGAAVLLRRMLEQRLEGVQTPDVMTQIKALGSQVNFAPGKYNPKAEELQKLLNRAGLHVRIDGYAGKITSGAYFSVAGKYLNGHPL